MSVGPSLSVAMMPRGPEQAGPLGANLIPCGGLGEERGDLRLSAVERFLRGLLAVEDLVDCGADEVLHLRVLRNPRPIVSITIFERVGDEGLPRELRHQVRIGECALTDI